MNVEIAQRLAARRKQAGLSQEALAEQLGVSRQAVSKWERSESSPDTDNLIALAQLYGVSLDELLYVDEQLRDDVVFEAADRAAQRRESATADEASAAAFANDAAASSASDEAVRPGKVHIGFDGIHVEDEGSTVHVSWRDGVHVVDGSKGDEVHVGWGGIHVKEASTAEAKDAKPAQQGRADGEWFGVTDDGIGGRDDEGNEFSVGASGVVVNGEHFDNWHDAHAKYNHGGSFEKPCGYTVCGERFDTLEAARAKYGPEVGKSIPVRKHYLSAFEKSWLKFPYPLVAIIVYLLLGFLNGAWGMGLFLFFTIPLYYLVGAAVGRRRIAPLVAGAYPVGVTAWFCYMAFVLNQPHPAWVAFLTIPLVEWLVVSLSHWWNARKRRARVEADAPIDVEAN